MTDDLRPYFERDLDAYWNTLVIGEDRPDAAGLDRETANQMRRLQSLLHAHPPAGADERVRRGVMAEIVRHHPQLDGMESSMNGNLVFDHRFAPAGAASAPPMLQPRRAGRPSWERGVSLIGVVALIGAMLTGVFIVYHGPRDNVAPAVVASPVPAVVASPATPASASGVFLPPDATVGGLSLTDWNVRAQQYVLSFPLAVNPWADTTGERCAYGQSGPVFFLGMPPAELDPKLPRTATRRCTVPFGVALFIPIALTECDNLSPTFFGADEAAQRACARANIGGGIRFILGGKGLTVDGQTVDLAPYHVTTPQFTLILPPGNINNAPAGIASAVGDGFQVLLAPLAPGEHVITIVSAHPGYENTVTYRLTVAAPLGSSPPATPAA